MVKRAKPAAADGGSRQHIGSGQNHAAETKATPDTTQAVLPIDQIIVRDRTIGLLNPITVDENGRLLAGARRLAACKHRERPLRGQR
jgi:ParB-like chromosome segregation protein Spo0J